jgi:RimJ/RimL family protein N-acetyltransferase
VWGRAQLTPTLEGKLVRLEPLAAAHEEQLWAAAADPETFRWMTSRINATRERFSEWLEQMLAECEAGRQASFAAIDASRGVAIGETSYLALRPEHRGLEIGWTWFEPSAWRTGVNLETKLLLLDHAFEKLGCIRVEFKTDALNDRSRKALAGIGATFEGIFRSHMVVRGELIRDSAYYSVIASEWPEVRKALSRKLERHLRAT